MNLMRRWSQNTPEIISTNITNALSRMLQEKIYFSSNWECERTKSKYLTHFLQLHNPLHCLKCKIFEQQIQDILSFQWIFFLLNRKQFCMKCKNETVWNLHAKKKELGHSLFVLQEVMDRSNQFDCCWLGSIERVCTQCKLSMVSALIKMWWKYGALEEMNNFRQSPGTADINWKKGIRQSDFWWIGAIDKLVGKEYVIVHAVSQEHCEANHKQQLTARKKERQVRNIYS